MIMGGLGVVVGIGLAVASKVFHVFVDPKILAVEDALPGANCGGCGLPGCSANAEAIVAGKAAPNSCVAAGPEVAEAIAAIMGMTIEAKEPDIARAGCTYGVADADVKFIYDGLSDCRAAAMLNGGMKVCSIGCLGLGSCAKACPFGAIVMGPKGLPVVIEEKCTGCGTCERVCPKNIINLSSVTRRILREYTTDNCTTPCQRACPAGIDICEYIRLIAEGDYLRSVQVIKERNPFPSVIGRICPRPCEVDCRRNFVDEPVAINFLKRFVADYEREQGQRIQPYKAPDTGRKIAVVGGGVEGLSTAFFTARLGHSTTVFEATSKLGGLLRSAIADYRLPRDILDWDIDGILEMGVTAETEKKLGRDFTVDSLLAEGYQAIFLASGGWDSRLARGAATTVETAIPGTYLLLDVIRFGNNAEGPIAVQSDVVLYGGGRMAIDAARLCKARGAEAVTLIFRETPDPALVPESELDQLKSEGIALIFNSGITRIFGEGRQLTQVEYQPLDGEERVQLAANTLIFAAGRLPELVFKPLDESDAESAPIKWEGVEPSKAPAYYQSTGLFAEGSVISDYSGAIKAIGAGRRAAATIHRIMYNLPIEHPENVVTPTTVVQDVDGVKAVDATTRQIMPLGKPGETAVGRDLEKGFNANMAKEEASRCLQCGLICYAGCGKSAEDKGSRDAA